MKSTNRLSTQFSVVLAVCLLAWGCNDAALALAGQGNDKLDRNGPAASSSVALEEYRKAMPSESQLKSRGFGVKYRLKEYHLEDPTYQETEVKAVRKRDGMEVQIVVCVAKDIAFAKRFLEAKTHGGSLDMLRGALSGRRLAEELWRSAYMEGVHPRGGFTLLGRDGLSTVQVRITYPITRKDERGRWIEEHFTQQDLMTGETLLIDTLRELTALGYTSRSTPAERAAAERRVAARAAVNKTAPEDPKPPSR
jgi:hypothetical protein